MSNPNPLIYNDDGTDKDDWPPPRHGHRYDGTFNAVTEEGVQVWVKLKSGGDAANPPVYEDEDATEYIPSPTVSGALVVKSS
jgi:hypothetical protein